MLDGLITKAPPPPGRAAKCDGDAERHLSEGAVMMAYALHLMGVNPTCAAVAIHPDGEHGKRFPFREWLEAQGFHLDRQSGTTLYGGEYRSEGGRMLTIHPASGLGDVVAMVGNTRIVAECKGGVINTRHPGQLSRLRRGLCEAVGLLASPLDERIRQVAVVPKTDTTEKMARRMAARASLAGIGVSLVDERGNVTDVV